MPGGSVYHVMPKAALIEIVARLRRRHRRATTGSVKSIVTSRTPRSLRVSPARARRPEALRRCRRLCRPDGAMNQIIHAEAGTRARRPLSELLGEGHEWASAASRGLLLRWTPVPRLESLFPPRGAPRSGRQERPRALVDGPDWAAPRLAAPRAGSNWTTIGS